ncbi:single-stranded DNA-binding protein [Nocardioides sp. InS609-2]|uniref:single-stranded DNA-binding protein n=1 Tax=Nocardioides sp. InS609-2 TaxID=2760705 RepID=UPI0020BDF810|nr:single-stranded DNA-binding protein [Nocardioides sp. InS609-2]
MDPTNKHSTAGDPVMNEVALHGRLAAEPEERELPSGDVIWTFRVIVERPPGGRSRQRVDSLECVAWLSRVRRSVATWRVGDQVAVEGALRRRFFRSGAATASRVEVEVTSARIIRRAVTS